MALDDIPEWVRTPNFLGAAEAGARAGLAARAEQREETGAGDRLRLAYDQLARQEKQQALEMQQRLKLGEAANALRAAHEKALLDHYGVMQTNANRIAAAQEASAALKAGVPTVRKGTHVKIGDKEYFSPQENPTALEPYALPKEDQAPEEASPIGDYLKGVVSSFAHPFVDKPNWRHPFTEPKKLDRAQASQFLSAAKGDKDKARQLARDAGFDF